MEKIKRASLYIFFALLAYMPVHILVSTWFGSHFGLLEVARILKDIVFVVGFVLALIAGVRESWFKKLLRDRLVLLILAFSALTVIMALIKPTDQDAEVLGVVYDLRFFVYFLYAALLTRMYKSDWLKHYGLRIALLVAVPVLVFGVAQYLWLPNDILTHVGYSRENGVLPAFFIDNKPDLERIMSTVRDPNSFASYVLIILAIVSVYWLKVKNVDLKRALLGMGALSALCLYFTFSRGAWIAAAVMAIILTFLEVKRRKQVNNLSAKILLPVTALLVVVGAGLFASRDTYFVKNVIFHADESTVLEDPNELRARFWRESLEAAVENPLGHGPGTAGLASIRNDVQGTVLNENYYLQVLYEVGIIGLGLFLAILGVIWSRIYQKRYDTFSYALLIAFVGLLVTNFFVHIWANEAVAYTFWGLAGLALFTSPKQQKF